MQGISPIHSHFEIFSLKSGVSAEWQVKSKMRKKTAFLKTVIQAADLEICGVSVRYYAAASSGKPNAGI
jgi:hypothetical protein